MKSWIGHHTSKLIQQWGAPTRVAPDGLGGEILVYEFRTDLRMFNLPPITRVRQFYSDSHGTIYRWRVHGEMR